MLTDKAVTSQTIAASTTPLTGSDALKAIISVAPCQLIRFAIDIRKQRDEGSIKDVVTSWEEREPNSVGAILQAYHYILALNETTITLDTLLNIHTLTTTNVRFDREVPWGIPNGVVAQNAFSIKETQFADPIDSPKDLEYLFDSGLHHRIYIEDKPKVEEGKEEFTQSLYVALKTNQQVKFSSYSNVVAIALQRVGKSLGNIREKTLLEIKTILHKYNDNISNPELTSDDKLTLIVITVQNLEQTHPFTDANCRTFCNVLLNLMLMQNGFLPALIEDPNYFDISRIDSLVRIIKEGIDRTNSLLRYLGLVVDETYEPKNDVDWMVPKTDLAYFQSVIDPKIFDLVDLSRIPYLTFVTTDERNNIFDLLGRKIIRSVTTTEEIRELISIFQNRRGIILASLKDRLCDLIKTPHELHFIILHLNAEQITELFLSLESHLLDLMPSEDSFHSVLQYNEHTQAAWSAYQSVVNTQRKTLMTPDATHLTTQSNRSDEPSKPREAALVSINTSMETTDLHTTKADTIMSKVAIKIHYLDSISEIKSNKETAKDKIQALHNLLAQAQCDYVLRFERGFFGKGGFSKIGNTKTYQTVVGSIKKLTKAILNDVVNSQKEYSQELLDQKALDNARTILSTQRSRVQFFKSTRSLTEAEADLKTLQSLIDKQRLVQGKKP